RAGRTDTGTAAAARGGRRPGRSSGRRARMNDGSAVDTTQRIRVFVTGGTFDKEYDELRGTLYFKQTHLPEMLQLGRCRLDVAIETLMMMDSLDMTEAERSRIV